GYQMQLFSKRLQFLEQVTRGTHRHARSIQQSSCSCGVESGENRKVAAVETQGAALPKDAQQSHNTFCVNKGATTEDRNVRKIVLSPSPMNSPQHVCEAERPPPPVRSRDHLAAAPDNLNRQVATGIPRQIKPGKETPHDQQSWPGADRGRRINSDVH